MIVDNIKNVKRYFCLGKRFDTALEYLKSTDFSKFDAGDYDIDGKNIYMLIRDYSTKTKEECEWEAHKKYIDVQYVAEGGEMCGYSDVSFLKEKSFVKDKDRLELEGNGDFIKLEKGFFIILFPEDAHMPGVTFDKPSNVRKVVLKVLMDEF